MLTSALPPAARSLAARRVALGRHPTLHGIDFVEVARELPDGWLLLVSFVPKEGGSPRDAVPAGITAAEISVREIWGEGHALEVVSVAYRELSPALEVRVRRHDPAAARDGAATYVLELRLTRDRPIDPYFARATFSLTTTAPLGQSAPSAAPVEPPAEAEIDYLAKDYASFRQLMLDRLTLLAPDWTERHPSDLGVALVELLAYAGDYLSYYQDAVATEAYLGTARRRISVRRHARLLDYRLHEGCNARVWVQLAVNAHAVELPAGTPLLTGLPDHPPRVPTLVYEAFESPEQLGVFETIESATLYQAHNELRLYAWGLTDYALEPGATAATLDGHFPHLRAGDVLSLEEVIDPATGRAADADREHRHAVRLAQPPALRIDPLVNRPVTEISWLEEDALPFRLIVAGHTVDGERLTGISVARGNLVLADSGRTIRGVRLPEVPADSPYRPTLRFGALTYRVDDAGQDNLAASAALTQDPREAMPAIRLFEGAGGDAPEWHVRRDLLGSDPFAREFVVESDNGGIASLRFGDGVLGQRPAPGRRFRATVRVHNEALGNVGPETVGHVVSDDGRILGARNPLPARGGALPEPIESARVGAPQAFKVQRSCVTPEDYAAAAERHPEVQRAVGRLDWAGSWHVIRVYVDRLGHRALDPAFAATLRAFLEPYRVAGYELDLAPPQFVPLAIRLTVRLAADAAGNRVRPRLIAAFSNVELPDGQRGFFHPANFGFGQTVYLSPIIAAARQIPGVTDVQVDEFHPLGTSPAGEIAAGKIEIGPLQIARVDNDPSAPEHGWIRFHLVTAEPVVGDGAKGLVP